MVTLFFFPFARLWGFALKNPWELVGESKFHGKEQESIAAVTKKEWN